MKKCVFAGTFDPFTAGHLSTADKCLALFDEVVIAVAENKNKTCMFSAKERAEMISAVFQDNPRVKVIIWTGVIVDLLKAENTPFYVRGVRNTVDFEYENADYFASKKLSDKLITLYVPAEQELLHVSSTLVKNSILFQKPYEALVPKAVYEYIQKRGELCLKNK
ncbi:MAG: pantetheine-phosphate adenylyltransferase [Clostridia bacterium]|nr:pantetheine-phosphate adenylyltransferase [Clostridia bacterium]